MNEKIFRTAWSYLGLQEIVGEKDNPVIVNWFNQLGFNGKKMKDETAWCSLFVNIVAMIVGVEYTGKLDARSWLKVGEKIENPKKGDVVIFWRESPTSWKGHVAFYDHETSNQVYVLGGNQNNKVCVKPYPKKRVLGYRRLRKI